MSLSTVITARPRTRRTPLGDVVTVLKVICPNGSVVEHVTLECPIELTEGREWPQRERVQ